MAHPVEKRRYRKIQTRMYADEKFLELSAPDPNGQSLWLYLLTGPHTTAVPGLFSAGEAQLAEALGWPLAGFRKAWNEIAQRGMARADWKARVVWLPNAIRYNAPDNVNQIKGWRDTIEEIRTCPLKAEAIAHVAVFLKRFRKPLVKPFLELFAKPLLEATDVGLANQEQEQEQDTPPNPPEGGQLGDQPPSPSEPPVDAIPPPVDPPDNDLRTTAQRVLEAALAEDRVAQDIGDLAARFMEGYPDVYARCRNGARIPMREARDFPVCCDLVTTWPDLDHLTDMLRLFLLRRDFAPRNQPGTPRQFAHMAPECDSLIRGERARRVS